MSESNLKSSNCRTCLVSIAEKSFYNIFDTLGLAKKLILCSALPVETTDEYPKNICQKCYKEILSFYDFQQMCRRSLNKFKELVNRNESRQTNEDGKGSHQIGNKSEDPLNGESESSNTLEGKAGSPLKKTSVKDQNSGRKMLNNNADSHIVEKTNDTIFLEDEMSEDMIEYFLDDKGNEIILQIERIPSNNEEDLDEEVQENVGREKNDLSPDMEKETQEMIFANAEKGIYECDLCSNSFKTLYGLRTHKMLHADYKYTCSVKGCRRSFNSRHLYSKHRKEHNLTPPPTYECDIENCKRVYKNKSALNIHKRKVHNFGPEVKTHMCEICGKVFKSATVLSDHKYTHSLYTDLPFACQEEGCTKRFSNKEKLRIHKMRHAGIKNFVCPYCNMRKTTRNELKIHINYHTLEKTWPCRFCSKVCNSAGNLKMHVKNMHERAKDFACRYCQRTFAKSDTRKYHEMTHTGEKPHECNECGRRFVQPAALRTHRKIHLRQKGILRENRMRKNRIVTEQQPKASMKDTREVGIMDDVLCDTYEI